MDCFRCPVCGSNEFVELIPDGGVWCDKCNSSFMVRGTCDGLRKVSIHCSTVHVYRNYKNEDLPPSYGTVVWESDERVEWLTHKNGKLVTVDPTPL